jgi:hypothetical protein
MDAAAERDLAAPGLQSTLKPHHLILYGISTMSEEVENPQIL